MSDVESPYGNADKLEIEVSEYLAESFSTSLYGFECLEQARGVISIVYKAIGVDVVKKLHESGEL